MAIHPALIEILNRKAGIDVTTAEGASYLRHDIESATGQRLSLNTVKRLTGVIAYDSDPREATLDIIARYLGYSSWRTMDAVMEGRTSVFGTDTAMTEVSSLATDTHIEMSWEPDRRIVLVHVGDGVCRVVEAVNSKLEAGDTLHLTQIADGFPLLAEKVVRNGCDLGPFSAGRMKGISLRINP